MRLMNKRKYQTPVKKIILAIPLANWQWMDGRSEVGATVTDQIQDAITRYRQVHEEAAQVLDNQKV